MALENESERTDESMSPITDAAKKADRAVRDTARTYLERLGIKLDLEQIEKSIRDKPLPSAAIAAAVSRKKQTLSCAASSGVSGGTRRVLT